MSSSVTSSLRSIAIANNLVIVVARACTSARALLPIGLAFGCSQPVTLLLSYNRAPEGRTGEATGIRFAFNHFAHSTLPIVAGALGSAFGITPVFMLIAAVLGASGYLGSTVKSSSEENPPRT